MKKIIKVCLSFLMLISVFSSNILAQEEQFKYVSDLDWISENNWSYSPYGGLKKNKKHDGNDLTLKVEGTTVTYNKGIGIHANGQVTYDISSLSKDYPIFIAKMGVDAMRNGLGQVFFKVFVSDDGNTWNEIYKSSSIKSSQDAFDVKLDVANIKYLRIYVDKDGVDHSDHGVVANMRLIKSTYDPSTEIYNGIKRVAEYDAELRNYSVEDAYNLHKSTIDKRNLVNTLGYVNIQQFVQISSDNKDAINWLISDDKNLNLLTLTGEIKNGYKFMDTLSKLYKQYKDVLSNEGDGLYYKKILIALAVAYSSDPYGSAIDGWWPSDNNTYDVVERYRILKKLFDDNLYITKEQVRNYPMEYLRMIVHDSLPNDDVLWLNNYSSIKHGNNLQKRIQCFAYSIAYKQPTYGDKSYYQESKREYTVNKYYLVDESKGINVPFGIDSNGNEIRRTWIQLEIGGICWNTSRFGQQVSNVNGIPARTISQPGHEACLYLYPNSDYTSYSWEIINNVGGWANAGTSYGLRLLLNYGNRPFQDRSKSASYILLAQDFMDQSGFEKSYYLNLLANSYSDYNSKIDVLNASIDAGNLNLDSYYGLILAYKEVNKTSSEWKQLANKILDVYKYYPRAMVELVNIIKPYLTEELDLIEIDMKQTSYLKQASEVKNIKNDSKVREVAQSLLGSQKVDLASFSFSGDNANTIVINSKYDNYHFEVGYTVDGSDNFIQTQDHKILLNDDQLQTLSNSKIIKVKIMGTNDVFTIAIQDGKSIVDSQLQFNDDENRFIGQIENLEYKIDGEDYKDYTSDIRFENDETVTIRYKANGTILTGPEKVYNFTINNDLKHQYIYVNQLEFVKCGSNQSGRDPRYMIDANLSTSWHTQYGKIETDKTYVVKLNGDPKYISKIAYDPEGVNGRIKDVKVYVSMDGVEFVEAGYKQGWQNDTQRKVIEFEPQLAQYIKIEALHTYGNQEGPDKYVSGKGFSYYEDITILPEVKTYDVTIETSNTDFGTVSIETIKDVKENTQIKKISDTILEINSQTIVAQTKVDDTGATVNTFEKWLINDVEYSDDLKVVGPTTIKAVFKNEEVKHTVKFYNQDTLLETKEVLHNQSLSYTTSNYSTDEFDYTFVGWYNFELDTEISLDNITSDLNVYAKFNSIKRKYNITFKSYDDSTLEVVEFEYGQNPTCSNVVNSYKQDGKTYTFNGWSPQISPVTKDETYIAQYTSETTKYKVNFVVDDGGLNIARFDVSELNDVAHGTKINISDNKVILGLSSATVAIEMPSDVNQYDRYIEKWIVSNDKTIVDEEAITITCKVAQKLKTHQITFLNYDGSVYKTLQLEYGSTINIENPVKNEQYKDHQFIGWSPNLETVSQDKSYTATYASKDVLTLTTEKNHKYELLSNTSNQIRIISDFNDFRSVKLDGQLVDPINYDAYKGSTIIIFKNNFLDKLSVGDHKVEVVFNNDTNKYTTDSILINLNISGEQVTHVNDLNTSRTCQDDGYPVGYTWSDANQACVLGQKYKAVVNTSVNNY